MTRLHGGKSVDHSEANMTSDSRDRADRLTDAQRRMLKLAARRGVVYVGDGTARRTRDSLAARGLLARDGERWAITDAGRAAL